jgi:hypothetical protein
MDSKKQTATESKKAESKKAESKKAESKKAKSPKAESKKAESKSAESKKAESKNHTSSDEETPTVKRITIAIYGHGTEFIDTTLDKKGIDVRIFSQAGKLGMRHIAQSYHTLQYLHQFKERNHQKFKRLLAQHNHSTYDTLTTIFNNTRSEFIDFLRAIVGWLDIVNKASEKPSVGESNEKFNIRNLKEFNESYTKYKDNIVSGNSKIDSFLLSISNSEDNFKKLYAKHIAEIKGLNDIYNDYKEFTSNGLKGITTLTEKITKTSKQEEIDSLEKEINETLSVFRKMKAEKQQTLLDTFAELKRDITTDIPADAELFNTYKLALENAEDKKNIRVYEPVCDKLFDISDKKESFAILMFSDPVPRQKGDTRINTKFREFVSSSSITLSEIIDFCKENGYTIINIVDYTCRTVVGLDESDEESEIYKEVQRISAMETESHINKHYGGKNRKTKRCRKQNKTKTRRHI